MLNIIKSFIPIFCSTYFIAVESTPIPYIMLLLKFIEEASLKYLVGQLISPKVFSSASFLAVSTGSRSTPITREAPLFTARNEHMPMPHPASRTRSPYPTALLILLVNPVALSHLVNSLI